MKTGQKEGTWTIATSLRATHIIGFALAIGLNLTGCKGTGDDRPTEEQGKAAILNHIQDKKYNHAGAIKLLSFRKINGMIQEGHGPKEYKMEFECEIEFTRNCTWDPNTWAGQGSFITNPVFGGVPVKAGQQAKVTSIIIFEKTDNGWRAKDIVG